MASRRRLIALPPAAGLAAWTGGSLAVAGAPAATSAGARSEAMMHLQSGYVDAGGVTLHVKRIGTGRPLVVLHGGPGASHDYLFKPLLPLARMRELIFVDQRGCGSSTAAPDDAGYTLARLVDDLERIRHALGLGRIDVFGHSFGGILAQAYALAHPHAVHALLLVGTGSCAAHVDADLLRVKQSAAPEVLQQLEAMEAAGIFEANGAQLQAYRQLADSVLLPFMYARRRPAWDAPATPYGWDALRLLWGARSDFEITGDLRGFDFRAGLSALHVPALVLYGECDMVSEQSARATHAALCASRLVRIDGAGHEMFEEQPAAFLQAVTSFLAPLA